MGDDDLPVMAACGDDQPQVTGTAHVDAAPSRGGQTSADPATELTVATTVAFTEGPTVAEDGTLYFTDLGNNRIMRLSTEGDLSTFRQPSNDCERSDIRQRVAPARL